MLPRRASNTWRTAAACYKLLADRRIGSATLVADAAGRPVGGGGRVGAAGRRDSGHDNDASPRRVTPPVGGYSEEAKYELRAGAFVVIASTSSSVSS